MISMRLKAVLLNSLLFCITTVCAQHRDISMIEDRNSWLTSDNAAALTTYADSSISVATLGYQYEGGRLRNYSDGSHEMTLKASARSYQRLSPQVVAYGRIGYENFSGTSMGGSMLQRDKSALGQQTRLQPFDILDDSLTNAGRKHCEKLCITGSVGWNAYRGFSLGASADFTAGTYAKYKDLRHSNTLMDLRSALSIHQSIPSWGSVGGCFLYNRSTETVTFSTFGTTDRVYKSLIAYANFMGEVETFGTEGFTEENREQPLLNEQVGLSMQLLTKDWQGVSLAGGFTFLHRTGYYGRQSQYTTSYANHDGNEYQWHIRLSLPSYRRMMLHFLDFNLTSEGLTTRRTNYRQVRSMQGGQSVTYYEYYTPTKVADKLLHQGRIAYTAYLQSAKGEAMGGFSVGSTFWMRKQTVYLYPLSYTQNLKTWQPFIKGHRHFSLGTAKTLTAEASVALNLGSGTAMEKGALECEYITATQLLAHAMATYEFPLRGVSGLLPCISLRYDVRKATSHTDYLAGSVRQQLTIAVGITF